MLRNALQPATVACWYGIALPLSKCNFSELCIQFHGNKAECAVPRVAATQHRGLKWINVIGNASISTCFTQLSNFRPSMRCRDWDQLIVVPRYRVIHAHYDVYERQTLFGNGSQVEGEKEETPKQDDITTICRLWKIEVWLKHKYRTEMYGQWDARNESLLVWRCQINYKAVEKWLVMPQRI